MPLTTGVFFDNSEVHRASFSSTFEYFGPFSKLSIIPIGESSSLPPIDLATAVGAFKLAKGNKYVQTLNAAAPSDSRWDPESGITAVHFRLMDSYLSSSPEPNDQKFVAFDWDRTLTVVEGLLPTTSIDPAIFPRDDTKSAEFLKLYREDMLLYLLGGPARLALIRAELRSLRTQGITLCILTSNTGGHSPAFRELVRQLDPGFRDEHIICSAGSSSKREALAKSKLFNCGGGGCIAFGGKRTRRRARRYNKLESSGLSKTLRVRCQNKGKTTKKK